MFKKILKNKMLMLSFCLLLLGFGVYHFVAWRDLRLEKRLQMLPKVVHVSLGKTGNYASTDFLVDSIEGSQFFMVAIETLDELTKDQVDSSTTSNGRTLKMDVLYKYRHTNTDKYKDWKNIKLMYVIREKYTGKEIFKFEYNPYDVESASKIKKVVYGVSLKKGCYVASVNILNGHSDFETYQTEVIFFHPAYSGSLINIWFELLDQILALTKF